MVSVEYFFSPLREMLTSQPELKIFSRAAPGTFVNAGLCYGKHVP